LAALCAGLGLAQGAQAGDFALILANGRYADAPNNRMAMDADGLARDLGARGFTVFQAIDDNAARMREVAAQMQAAMQANPDPDRVVIAVTGYFANRGSDAWLLEPASGAVTPLNVGGRGISLSALAGLAAEAPGQAVMLIAAPDGSVDMTPGIAPGPGEVAAPQGVTIVAGSMDRLRRWTRDMLLDPRLTLEQALINLPRDTAAYGFRSAAVHFADAGDGGGNGIDSPMGEMAYWNAVRDIGTTEAYAAYLNRYPQGIFADEAGQQVNAVPPDPRTLAEQGEAALNLGRDARRQIQRNLSLLGFDPRGIDGIFGRGSRTAITAWQRSRGQPDTGFLSAPEIDVLQRQADVRAAELEREAQLRREAEERADRQYWSQVGRDEPGLRAYLGRYPDGLFADEAQARLDRILEERRNRAEARERAAWDQTRQVDSIEAYQAFLAQFPNGSFADAARDRLEELIDERDNRARNEAARAEEGQVVPSAGARLLVEKMLAVYGQDPGPQDGKFTRETRKAIRRFQRSRDLPVTGFVNQQTMVMLMLGERNR
jgi:peptidoglycan hydrolase-like protein with peptidoglycan-binding domain